MHVIQAYHSKYIYLVCIIIFLSSYSCENNSIKINNNAGTNKSQIEEALSYFENSTNSLGYESVIFLIKNMAYHGSYNGICWNNYDSIYSIINQYPQNERGNYINDFAEKNNLNNGNFESDMRFIKSDFIINWINQICRTWQNSPWSNTYSKNLFFDYVLPYRVHSELLSDWRTAIYNEFPLLNDSVVLARRGIQFEAENAHQRSCNTRIKNGASHKKIVLLDTAQSSLTFHFHSERNTYKRIIIKYSTTSKDCHIAIILNGKIMKKIKLSPTRNNDTFNEKWSNFKFPIQEGNNTIRICGAKDSIGIDYIQLSSIETFTANDVINLSPFCYNFVNNYTGHLISINNHTKTIECKKFDEYTQKYNKNLLCLNYQGYPLWNICCSEKGNENNCLEVKFGTENTLCPNNPINIGKYESRPFQQWILLPIKNGLYRIMNKHTGMFLEEQKDKKSNKNILVQNLYTKNPNQLWKLIPQKLRSTKRSIYDIGSPISWAMKVYDITHQFEFFIHNINVSPTGSTLIKSKTGKCIDEASFTIYLCRYLGIPSTYDFTPNWGNRRNGHSWSVLIKPDGKGIPFYMGNVPGDTVHYFHSYKKPKIFRQQFRLNQEYYKKLKESKYIPSLFRYPTFIDVTDEYTETSDIKRQIPVLYSKNKLLYICVFNNQEWVPVFFGEVKNQEVVFKSMGRDIVYILGINENGRIRPIGNPFLLDKKGHIKDFAPTYECNQSMTVLRKYPFFGKEDYFNSRMDGGQFQGANNQSFFQYDTLHTHHGITNGNWYNIKIKKENKYKYLRYIGGKGSFCNVNEIEFYDENRKKISGKIIGTEGEKWALKENVFDGDILTGFCANSPDGNWVGLKLSKPTQISEIRYIPRNDGNCIETGDKYALYYWNNEKWNLIETQIAKENQLFFKEVPCGVLFWIKDLTKGSEERIFSYNNNKQIWW